MAELNQKKIYIQTKIIDFINHVEKILFPQIYEKVNVKKEEKLARRVFIKFISNDEGVLNKFFSQIEDIRKELYEDIKFTFDGDPACDAYEEIVLAYPGFLAIKYYRIAHRLRLLGLNIVSRIISEQAHKLTGIDIHPGAEILSPICIDHGTGVVIGETTIIGKNCKIYQGVTLGALSTSRGQLIADVKRHPTIGNNVTIYAGASILGGDVVIGDNVVIGSNVFLTESIPCDHKVKMSKPELVVIKKGEGKC
jgi:serine O-acetyltransferase